MNLVHSLVSDSDIASIWHKIVNLLLSKRIRLDGEREFHDIFDRLRKRVEQTQTSEKRSSAANPSTKNLPQKSV